MLTKEPRESLPTAFSLLHVNSQFKRWLFLESPNRMWFGGSVAKSCPTLVTPWTVASQAPLSMGLSSHKYWNAMPFSSPGGLPGPEIEPRDPVQRSLALPAVGNVIKSHMTRWFKHACRHPHTDYIFSWAWMLPSRYQLVASAQNSSGTPQS